MATVKIKKRHMLVFFREQITMLRAKNRFGTARNYQSTMNSFSTFLCSKDITFSSCNEELVQRYDTWLQKSGVSRNTSSFYMRILRSVYNKAVRLRLVKQTYPFANVYTSVDHTRKRAVSEQVIIQLKKLDLSFSPALSLARDIFIFSYATRGMSFIDIAFLRKENIINNTITYGRHKTGQILAVHIEPCIKRILNSYLNNQHSTPYIFPFISSTDPNKAYTQYQTALGYYNRLLKKLGKLIDVKVSLTSYTPRHTWATAARNHNIPISVISAGMGHTSEKTTQIYLATLENSIVDQANHKILEMMEL